MGPGNIYHQKPGAQKLVYSGVGVYVSQQRLHTLTILDPQIGSIPITAWLWFLWAQGEEGPRGQFDGSMALVPWNLESGGRTQRPVQWQHGSVPTASYSSLLLLHLRWPGPRTAAALARILAWYSVIQLDVQVVTKPGSLYIRIMQEIKFIYYTHVYIFL